jgi:predicted dehydrogenase
MTPSEPVGVGLIGTGVTVRTHLPAFAEQNRFNVVGISGSSPERARLVADANGIERAYSSVEELCADPAISLIVLASPNEFHERHFGLALASGKDIIVEKPLASDTQVARRLVSLPVRDGQFICVNHQLRFHPVFKRMRELAESGALGRIYRSRVFQEGSAFVDPATPWFWSFDSQAGGGVRWAMGSHLVDLWRYLQPRESVYKVSGALDAVMPVRGERDCNSSACMIANVQTERGCNSEITASAFGFGEYQFEVTLCGDRGEATFDLQRGLRTSSLETKGRWVVDERFADIAAEVMRSGSFFRAASKYFVEDLAAGYSRGDLGDVYRDVSKLSDVLPNHAILDWVLESALSGREKIVGEFAGSNAVT